MTERAPTALLSIMETIRAPDIFGAQLRGAASWGPWLVCIKAIFGIDLDPEDMPIFVECTARTEAPSERAKEGWLIVGRRGGKSRVLALIASYLAAFIDWSPFLSPGERGHIVIVAADRKQCRTIMSYIRAFLARTELLADLIGRDLAEELELTNGITIEVVTCSYRAVRGRTVIAALGDEAAFWADESGANPASEVIASLRPAMATIPGAMLLVASSPYARRGPLFRTYQQHYGKPGPILVWKAATRTMNPSVPQSFIDEAYEADPASAAAEYGAEFRKDIETFIPREVVEEAVVPGRRELPAIAGVNYFAFIDPSGGSSDSMTLAIAHLAKDDHAVVDLVREWRPPFSPESVVDESAALLRAYRCRCVTGDRYGGEWCREPFRKRGLAYELSDRPASDIYRDALPLLNAGRVELLDVPRLVAQLCNLERRVARSGKDMISHPVGPQHHDDVAVSVCGALLLAANKPARLVVTAEDVARAAAGMRIPQRSRFGQPASFYN